MTSKPSAPREWTLIGSYLKRIHSAYEVGEAMHAAIATLPQIPVGEEVHVIEYSAFQALERECAFRKEAAEKFQKLAETVCSERDAAIAERDALGALVKLQESGSSIIQALDAALAKAQAMEQALEKIANIKIFSHDVREDLVISIASVCLAKWRGKE